MAGDIKILDSISINQNLIMAIAFYAGAYLALPIDGATLQEEMQIGGIMRFVLYGICVIGLFVAMISLLSSLIAYSIEYYKKKIYKGEQYKQQNC